MQTSISIILSQTWGVLTARIGPMLGLWATFLAMQIGLLVLMGTFVSVSALSTVAGGDPGAFTGGIMLGVVLAYLAYFYIAFAQAGALSAMASPLQKLSFGEALQAGLRSGMPMIGVLLILLVFYLIAAVVLGVIGGVLGSAGTAVIGLLALAGLIYFGSRLCVVYAVIAVDRVSNPITALTRSWAMTRSSVLTIVGIMLIFVVAFAVIGALLFVPLFASISAAATSSINGGGYLPEFGSLIFVFIAFLVFMIVTALVSAALFSVIHAVLSGSTVDQAGDVFS